MKQQLLRCVAALSLAAPSPAPHATPLPATDELLTVAEASGWRATSTHAECVDLCQRLAESSPRIHLEEAGRSVEGRSLALLVIADPPVREPADVGGRLVAFAWGGIHAGEVCGKPATLMLAREMARTEEHPLLEKLVVVLLPLLNADGNDDMSPDNRPGQQGPVEGMGKRRNAQGLNINRDFTKLETPEARAVARVLTRWKPAIAIDLHTTNGSRHQYVLTYDAQRHPACDPQLLRWARGELLPAVTRSMEAEQGYKTFFYGNFNRDKTRWSTYPAEPRYSTHYLGLRHHVGLLSEAYSYAPYRDRVMGTLAFVRHTFQYAADHERELRPLLAGARSTALEREGPSPEDAIALRADAVERADAVTVLGFTGARGSEESAAFEVTMNDASAATVAVRRPFAYMVPAVWTTALDNLRAHGIELETTTAETKLAAEVYRIDSIARSGRTYEQHEMVSVEVSAREEQVPFPAGTFVVRTDQDLGGLAAYLLEPQAADGLCAWNFFDSALSEGADFPVVRLVAPVPLETQPERASSAPPGSKQR